jgi:hypothetical protein
MDEIDELLSYMDSEGDGWYGKASSAIRLLRTRLAACEQQLKDTEHDLEHCPECGEGHLCGARQQLAACEQERDQWKSWCEQTPSADMVRRCATAEAKVKELEQQLTQKTILEHAVGLDAAWEVAKANNDDNIRLRERVKELEQALREAGDWIGDTINGAPLECNEDQICVKIKTLLGRAMP